MNLPENVRAALRQLVHAEPNLTDSHPVGDGVINPSARVEINGQRYFVKWNSSAPLFSPRPACVGEGQDASRPG